MPADPHATLPLPRLSPIGGKPNIARFDGGALSSGGGLLTLREGGVVSAWPGISRRAATIPWT